MWCLMQVSPPDAHGFVSLGLRVDCTLTASRCAKTVIAEVNEQMPRTHGDTAVHVSHISAIVETIAPAAGTCARSLSRNCIMRVAQQCGLADSRRGNAADRHWRHSRGGAGLSERQARSGNSHRDWCPDGVIDLMEAGVINGERKTLHRGKAVVSFVLGSRAALRFHSTTIPLSSSVRSATPTIRLWWRRTTAWSPSIRRCKWI